MKQSSELPAREISCGKPKAAHSVENDGAWMVRFLFIFSILQAFSASAFSQPANEFRDIASFIGSLNSANIRGSAEGDLMGKGRTDWVGIVASKDQDNEEIVEIYVLEKSGSGNYRVAEKSAPRPAFGGTGNFGYEDISVQDQSFFVTFSFHWHSCAGNSISQFKRTRKGWQLAGIESFETNAVDGSGRDIATSSNLLTGKAIIKKAQAGKSEEYRLKTVPRLFLLKDYSGEGTISMHEKGSLC